MSSTNYLINWDSVNSGGDDNSSSTNYQLRDTVGEQATGFSSSSLYTLSAGYRTGDRDLTTLSFSIGTQENATEVAYSAISTTTNTVTVASAANFSIGDFIGVAENVGLSQRVVVGRVSSIASNTITVDQWDGATSTISSTPAGGNDFAYRMNGSNAVLGVLSPSTGKTSITLTNVSSDAANGYTVDVYDDGDLRYGSSTILNVSDGSVTVGSEEYGAEVFGDYASGTGTDFAFASSTAREIQVNSAPATRDRVVLVYKISISGSTAAGDYSHQVIYRLTPNY